MVSPGSRVGAILSSKGKDLSFLGYGVYEGDFVPTESSDLLDDLKQNNILNPRIKLDNGDIIYGCECWWGDEEQVKKRLSQYKVTIVRIADFRGIKE